MATVLDKTFLLLSDDKSSIFNSTKTVSWSHDNRVVLCCAEKLLIVSTIVSPYMNSKTEPFMTRIDGTPDIYSLEKFSFASDLLNFEASIDNLNEEDRQRLSLDPSLTEEPLYPNSIANTFKHAVCSPMCLRLDRPQNLIASVTYNHRVVIFVERSEGWDIALDCSPVMKEHTVSNMKLPMILGEDVTLDRYIDLVHNMCSVELEWSSVFSSGGSSEESFLLLFIGTRAGTITVWKACLPFETKEDFSFQCTDIYTSEVTALSWFSRERDKGFLAVGYLDGSLRVLSVCIDFDLPSCVQIKEMFADFPGDGLAILDLAWAKVSKNTTALIGCKHYFLSVYSLCSDTVELVQHYHTDVCLPLTSISTFGAYGMASSQDGCLIKFQCKQNSGQISLEWSTVTITSIAFSPDLSWLCFGLALSPYSGLCISTHRINHTCGIVELRRKLMNRQMIVLSDIFKLTVGTVDEALSPGTDEKMDRELWTLIQNANYVTYQGQSFSPQHIMISLRLQIQQIAHTNGSLQDILQIYRELNQRNDIISMQVIRDMLLFLGHYGGSSFHYQKELEWVSSEHKSISEKLIIKHIESCLQNVSSSPTANESLVIKAMLKWLIAGNATSSNFSNTVDLTKLTTVTQQSSDPQCAICGSDSLVSSIFCLLNVPMVIRQRFTRGFPIGVQSLSADDKITMRTYTVAMSGYFRKKV